MDSNVVALRLRTGRVLWRFRFDDNTPGPNGLAVAGGRVFGATDTRIFALSARTGKLLWSRFLVTATQLFVEIAPQVAGDTVYASTIGVVPNGKGVLYALGAASGRVRWQRSSVRGRWAIPQAAGGGGAWYTPSVSSTGVYWGIANPYPYGGTPSHPNGGAYAGPDLYTDSLVVTDRHSGRVLWYDQVSSHDVRDYDFEAPPILATLAGRSEVIGAGKAGLVIAWNARTHRRLWVRSVGVHRNDAGPLPRKPETVCPGLYGGVLTPMAYAQGTVYVPVVNLCARGSASGYQSLASLDVASGRGELVAIDAATGAVRWTAKLPQPDFGCATLARGVVFTSTFDGTVYGLDADTGKVLWSARAPAGINSCPSVVGGSLLVGAGIGGAGRTTALEDFSLDGRP
jgi:outer membrane protein assembly factor BamB